MSESSPPHQPDDPIKIVDRRGKVKTISRQQYETGKRRRRRRSDRRSFEWRDLLSAGFILAVILLASYFAFQIIK